MKKMNRWKNEYPNEWKNEWLNNQSNTLLGRDFWKKKSVSHCPKVWTNKFTHTPVINRFQTSMWVNLFKKFTLLINLVTTCTYAKTFLHQIHFMSDLMQCFIFLLQIPWQIPLSYPQRVVAFHLSQHRRFHQVLTCQRESYKLLTAIKWLHSVSPRSVKTKKRNWWWMNEWKHTLFVRLG